MAKLSAEAINFSMNFLRMAPFRKILARAQARLKSFGLEISDSVSEGNFVVLYNAGALNNISKSAIENFVAQSLGSKAKIFLPKIANWLCG